jgi:2-C-methyl-D-erythritol 4-phosphate cytidylyltransferase
MIKRSVIITAGGIGRRTGNVIPKQFLLIGNLPILAHTINEFYSFDNTLEIVVTLPNDWVDYWKSLINSISFTVPHSIVVGGVERFHSIKNALTTVHGEHIAIHDGVRPFVSVATIERCFSSLEKFEAVVPVVDLKDTIRQVNRNDNFAVDRKNFRIIHTPQCFHAEIIRRAYRQEFTENITDDASLVEQLGVKIHFVPSNQENIKITDQFDLIIAQSFIMKP